MKYLFAWTSIVAFTLIYNQQASALSYQFAVKCYPGGLDESGMPKKVCAILAKSEEGTLYSLGDLDIHGSINRIGFVFRDDPKENHEDILKKIEGIYTTPETSPADKILIGGSREYKKGLYFKVQLAFTADHNGRLVPFNQKFRYVENSKGRSVTRTEEQDELARAGDDLVDAIGDIFETSRYLRFILRTRFIDAFSREAFLALYPIISEED